ncbi:MAG: TusE/DsrC/DsvC family sulfur relay protein [Lewinella sp.]|jgi:tRNA 2-thiouridine synthesizing protein E|uniref:TusE/DsrC/DsvC family sulfur relay protein n=1 Tax=Lewinella sp. TaxID=2004506 RepID=UPI003D6AC261
MATRAYAGTNVACNDEGYLTNLEEWTQQVGREIATEEEVEMTPKHWEVISFLQDQYRAEVPLTIRKIGKSGVTSIKEFYQLFPNGPLKKASRIAGIPKPVSCI